MQNQSGYNNFQNGDDEMNQPGERKMSRNAIQSQLAIISSDIGSRKRQKESLEQQIKKAKRTQERMLMEINDKEEEVRKLEFEMQEMEREQKKLKAKLNKSFVNN